MGLNGPDSEAAYNELCDVVSDPGQNDSSAFGIHHGGIGWGLRIHDNYIHDVPLTPVRQWETFWDGATPNRLALYVDGSAPGTEITRNVVQNVPVGMSMPDSPIFPSVYAGNIFIDNMIPVQPYLLTNLDYFNYVEREDVLAWYEYLYEGGVFTSGLYKTDWKDVYPEWFEFYEYYLHDKEDLTQPMSQVYNNTIVNISVPRIIPADPYGANGLLPPEDQVTPDPVYGRYGNNRYMDYDPGFADYAGGNVQISKEVCENLGIEWIDLSQIGARAVTPEPPIAFPGRPVIKNNSIYTAWDTPIRGTMLDGESEFSDWYASFAAEGMRNARDNGLNALHMYTGDTDENGHRLPVDFYVEINDFVVEEAAKNGLYVIFTISWVGFENVEEDTQFLYDFWEFYAPRYKDKENVIFEICNEIGWREGLPEVVANAYNIIRSHAPDTMVLPYSFAVCVPPEWGIEQYLKETERFADIPWTNEAVAFHSYETHESAMMGADWLYHVIDAFIGEGYPIINTEVPNRYELSRYPDVKLYSILEEKGISWLGFVSANLTKQATFWRGQFEAAGLAWQPDYGNWPVTDAIFPFGVQSAAEHVTQTTAQTAADQGHDVLFLSNGDFARYGRVNFGTREPLSFRVSVKAPGGGTITVHEGGPDGPVLGSIEISESENYVTVNGELHTAVSGLPDITFVFTGDGPAILRDWQFVLPRQVSYTDPLKIIQAANYPFRTGGIVRRPSTDSGSEARFQVEGITDGSSLRFDFVRFRDNNAIPFHIRAMPLAGGTVEIYATDETFKDEWLGSCEISGPSGVWADFSCELDLTWVLLFGGDNSRWDLKLVFRGEDGKELFAVSEFYFGRDKPGPAELFAPEVKTGSAQSITAHSAVITGNGFFEFDGQEILEVGVIYSVSCDFDFDQEYTYIAKADGVRSPFTLTLTDLEPHPDLPYINYRAYAKTATGTYFGGVKRFVLDNLTKPPEVHIVSLQITVTTPVSGQIPDTAVGYDGPFTVGPVTWKPGDTPFAADKQYTATMTLTANNGYTFAGIIAANTVINGKKATIVSNTGAALTLSNTFPATTPTVVEMEQPIKTAVISVTAPVTGGTPDSTATGTGNFTVGSVVWTPGDATFQANRQYTATVTLTADNGYSFTGIIAGNTVVNGKKATIVSNTGVALTLSYTFTMA